MARGRLRCLTVQLAQREPKFVSRLIEISLSGIAYLWIGALIVINVVLFGKILDTDATSRLTGWIPAYAIPSPDNSLWWLADFAFALLALGILSLRDRLRRPRRGLRS
jgi:hypothetical protein